MPNDSLPDDSEGTTRSLVDSLTGEFVRERLLGKGGFGEVWLARQPPPLSRPVALKVLLPPESPGSLVERVAALRNEAAVLARLKHRNVVQVFDWREVNGLPVMVLEYVPGGSFRDILREHGPLSWSAAARYVADAAEGLLEVHRRGLVHRDIKPANLLRDDADGRDECVLTDFGVAARLGDPASPAGTVAYMAPEVFDARPPEPAQDVYGLAATLFRLVTGLDPFPLPPGPAGRHPSAEQVRAVFLPLVRAGLPDPDPRFAGMPAALERVVRAGLAARPEDRPAPADFLRGLRGALNQSLADALPPQAVGSPGLRLVVRRADDSTVAAQSTRAADRVARDLKRVPPPPSRVRLRTCDTLRVEVVSDRDGFVSVFNVGPAGKLNPLCPEEPGRPGVAVRAGVPLHALDATLQPPAGRERVFAVWTADARPVLEGEMLTLSGAGPSPAYRASRDLVRVRERVDGLPASGRSVAVLEIEHEG